MLVEKVVTNTIALDVVKVKGTDFSVVRSEWKSRKTGPYEHAVIVKTTDVEKILSKISAPNDISKYHHCVLHVKDNPDYKTYARLVKEYFTDYRSIFQEDDVLFDICAREIEPLEGYKVIMVCFYDHTVFDTEMKPLVYTHKDFITGGSWKLRELIKFSETVDWLEFRLGKYRDSKIDYVHGNGEQAYPKMKVDPVWYYETRKRVATYELFGAIMEHYLGKEATDAFRVEKSDD